MTKPEFMECTSCATKPGTAKMCKACLHNRSVINALNRTLSKPALQAGLLRVGAVYVRRDSETYVHVAWTDIGTDLEGELLKMLEDDLDDLKKKGLVQDDRGPANQ